MDISAPAITSRRQLSREMTEYIREEPLTALAAAAAAGFILGGGVTRRVGLVMLTIAGRIALRGITTGLIAGIGTGRHDNWRQDRSSPGSGSHDNGRRAFTNPG
ncbi:MAG TPA: hypothetical protein VMV27_11675 [Candidatus Binataceae bacterium]|nr:hypothetical protein [Candidatus Binataceae bacterium]